MDRQSFICNAACQQAPDTHHMPHSANFECRYGLPGPGIAAANAGLQAWSTTGIFVISGLGLKRGEAASAATAWGSVLFGLVCTLLLSGSSWPHFPGKTVALSGV